MTILENAVQLKGAHHFKLVRLDDKFAFAPIRQKDELHATLAEKDGLVRNPRHLASEKFIVSDGTALRVYPRERIHIEPDLTGSCVIEGTEGLYGDTLKAATIRIRRVTTNKLANLLGQEVEAEIPYTHELFVAQPIQVVKRPAAQSIRSGKRSK